MPILIRMLSLQHTEIKSSFTNFENLVLATNFLASLH